MNECPQSNLKKTTVSLQEQWAADQQSLKPTCTGLQAPSVWQQAVAFVSLTPEAAETTTAFHVAVYDGGRPARQPAINY